MLSKRINEKDLINFAIKVIKSKDRSKKVGKTYVQKIIYLIYKEGIGNFDYFLHYYGPYSTEVACSLEELVSEKQFTEKWEDEYGYDYIPNKGVTNEDFVNLEDIKSKIEHTIDKYIKYSAKDISLIATAIYIKNKDIINDKLVQEVHRIKPQFSIEQIKEILEKASIIQN